jgi:hypothetical protein
MNKKRFEFQPVVWPGSGAVTSPYDQSEFNPDLRCLSDRLYPRVNEIFQDSEGNLFLHKYDSVTKFHSYVRIPKDDYSSNKFLDSSRAPLELYDSKYLSGNVIDFPNGFAIDFPYVYEDGTIAVPTVTGVKIFSSSTPFENLEASTDSPTRNPGETLYGCTGWILGYRYLATSSSEGLKIWRYSNGWELLVTRSIGPYSRKIRSGVLDIIEKKITLYAFNDSGYTSYPLNLANEIPSVGAPTAAEFADSNDDPAVNCDVISPHSTDGTMVYTLKFLDTNSPSIRTIGLPVALSIGLPSSESMPLKASILRSSSGELAYDYYSAVYYNGGIYVLHAASSTIVDTIETSSIEGCVFDISYQLNRFHEVPNGEDSLPAFGTVREGAEFSYLESYAILKGRVVKKIGSYQFRNTESCLSALKYPTPLSNGNFLLVGISNKVELHSNVGLGYFGSLFSESVTAYLLESLESDIKRAKSESSYSKRAFAEETSTSILRANTAEVGVETPSFIGRNDGGLCRAYDLEGFDLHNEPNGLQINGDSILANAEGMFPSNDTYISTLLLDRDTARLYGISVYSVADDTTKRNIPLLYEEGVTLPTKYGNEVIGSHIIDDRLCILHAEFGSDILKVFISRNTMSDALFCSNKLYMDDYSYSIDGYFISRAFADYRNTSIMSKNTLIMPVRSFNSDEINFIQLSVESAYDKQEGLTPLVSNKDLVLPRYDEYKHRLEMYSIYCTSQIGTSEGKLLDLRNVIAGEYFFVPLYAGGISTAQSLIRVQTPISFISSGNLRRSIVGYRFQLMFPTTRFDQTIDFVPIVAINETMCEVFDSSDNTLKVLEFGGLPAGYKRLPSQSEYFTIGTVKTEKTLSYDPVSFGFGEISTVGTRYGILLYNKQHPAGPEENTNICIINSDGSITPVGINPYKYSYTSGLSDYAAFFTGDSLYFIGSSLGKKVKLSLNGIKTAIGQFHKITSRDVVAENVSSNKVKAHHGEFGEDISLGDAAVLKVSQEMNSSVFDEEIRDVMYNSLIDAYAGSGIRYYSQTNSGAKSPANVSSYATIQKNPNTDIYSMANIPFAFGDTVDDADVMLDVELYGFSSNKKATFRFHSPDCPYGYIITITHVGPYQAGTVFFRTDLLDSFSISHLGEEDGIPVYQAFRYAEGGSKAIKFMFSLGWDGETLQFKYIKTNSFDYSIGNEELSLSSEGTEKNILVALDTDQHLPRSVRFDWHGSYYTANLLAFNNQYQSITYNMLGEAGIPAQGKLSLDYITSDKSKLRIFNIGKYTLCVLPAMHTFLPRLAPTGTVGMDPSLVYGLRDNDYPSTAGYFNSTGTVKTSKDVGNVDLILNSTEYLPEVLESNIILRKEVYPGSEDKGVTVALGFVRFGAPPINNVTSLTAASENPTDYNTIIDEYRTFYRPSDVIGGLTNYLSTISIGYSNRGWMFASLGYTEIGVTDNGELIRPSNSVTIHPSSIAVSSTNDPLIEINPAHSFEIRIAHNGGWVFSKMNHIFKTGDPLEDNSELFIPTFLSHIKRTFDETTGKIVLTREEIKSGYGSYHFIGLGTLHNPYWNQQVALNVSGSLHLQSYGRVRFSKNTSANHDIWRSYAGIMSESSKFIPLELLGEVQAPGALQSVSAFTYDADPLGSAYLYSPKGYCPNPYELSVIPCNDCSGKYTEGNFLSLPFYLEADSQSGGYTPSRRAGYFIGYSAGGDPYFKTEVFFETVYYTGMLAGLMSYDVGYPEYLVEPSEVSALVNPKLQYLFSSTTSNNGFGVSSTSQNNGREHGISSDPNLRRNFITTHRVLLPDFNTSGSINWADCHIMAIIPSITIFGDDKKVEWIGVCTVAQGAGAFDYASNYRLTTRFGSVESDEPFLNQLGNEETIRSSSIATIRGIRETSDGIIISGGMRSIMVKPLYAGYGNIPTELESLDSTGSYFYTSTISKTDIADPYRFANLEFKLTSSDDDEVPVISVAYEYQIISNLPIKIIRD